jgi:hypothetical protein
MLVCGIDQYLTVAAEYCWIPRTREILMYKEKVLYRHSKHRLVYSNRRFHEKYNVL